MSFLILNTDDLATGNYTFTYTAIPVVPCTDDEAKFTVRFEQEVFAGPDSITTVCNEVSAMEPLLDEELCHEEIFESQEFESDLATTIFTWSITTGGLFESYDPAHGWDGTYGDGSISQDESYIWKISFKETMSDEGHEDVGNVYLLR